MTTQPDEELERGIAATLREMRAERPPVLDEIAALWSCSTTPFRERLARAWLDLDRGRRLPDDWRGALLLWAFDRTRRLENALEAAKLTKHGVGASSFGESGQFYGLCDGEDCDCGVEQHNAAIDATLTAEEP